MTNNCSYGTECHYSHEPLKKAYRCYQCGEEFNTRSDMMMHRKNYHMVEDCREFLKDAIFRYRERCWWAPSLSGGGFLGCPTKTNSTKHTKSTEQTKHACQKCGKKHNEGGLNVSNNEWDEQTHEHANEPITQKILTEKDYLKQIQKK